LTLIAAQVICVAVGLWIQHQYVRQVSTTASKDHAWAEMEQIALGLRENPDNLFESAVLEGGLERLAGPSAAGREGILIDTDKPNPQIHWRPERPVGEPSVVRGTLMIDGQEHLGVGVESEPRGRWCVVYQSVESATATSDAFVEFLPGAGLTALLWISAVLGLSVILIVTRAYDGLVRRHAASEERSIHRTQAFVRTRDAIIFGLAKLADSRDPETGEHLERMTLYCSRLASAMRRLPKYRRSVNSRYVRLIELSSALHDIGKVGIEDRILRKPGPLDADERTKMEKHSEIGGQCLAQIERRLGASNFLQMAGQIAWSHHERWDGAGYPHGLSGESIPLSARIVALTDMYDALSSRRCYKEAFSHERCVRIIQAEAGKQLDPDLVEIFMSIERHFEQIAARYSDPPESTDAAPLADGPVQLTVGLGRPILAGNA
jgi:HD-GYP domain-containing protein (c-di-GMP phosphodiesterase class II)